jgi:hypothetical protein
MPNPAAYELPNATYCKPGSKLPLCLVLDAEVDVLDETAAPRFVAPLQLSTTTALTTKRATAVTEHLGMSMRL